MAKKIFIDMDNTLTESKAHISKEMFELIYPIREDIVIVSGSELSQIHKQIGNEFYTMGCSGNHCEFWCYRLSYEEKEEILNFLQTLPNGDDFIQDRSCQISYSLIGHNAPQNRKDECDPDKSKRRLIIEKFKSETIQASIGGTTCIDFYKKGFSKGDNVIRYLEVMGWTRDECVYVGDGLFPGGNDESVIGKIETIAVNNPEETYGILQTIRRRIR